MAGFTGVVAFLGQRARGEWRAVDLFRFNQLLSSSFAALLFAFVPMVVHRLGASEPTGWRVTSLAIAAFILLTAGLSRRRMAEIPADEMEEIIPLVLRSVVLTALMVSVLQLMNAVGLVYDGESGPVLLALVWLLAFSGFQFVRLLKMLRVTAAEGD